MHGTQRLWQCQQAVDLEKEIRVNVELQSDLLDVNNVLLPSVADFMR